MITRELESTEFKKNEYRLVCLSALLFVALLFVRDVYGININKYIFVALTAVVTYKASLLSLSSFICFTMPLMVGLPGNYMILIFLTRFILESRNLSIKITSIFFTFLVCVFVLFQNTKTGNTSFAEMAFIPSAVFILLYFAFYKKADVSRMILSYICGVAVVGIIMLVATLQSVELLELMQSSNRLGSTQIDYSVNATMKISIDPNYYGFFSIAALTLSPMLFASQDLKGIYKRLAIMSIVSIIIVALIGLSRSFVIVLIIWILTLMISQRKIKNFAITICLVAVGIVILNMLLPEVMEGLTTRFNDSDMATGNNRTTIMMHFFNQWFESIPTIFFGVGMYRCNVHCMPIQFLFGGGIIYTFFIVAYALTLNQNRNIKLKTKEFIPILCTFVMSCTVPVATSITFMFPLLFVIFCLYNGGRKNEEQKTI